jgi:hypothetical protein
MEAYKINLKTVRLKVHKDGAISIANILTEIEKRFSFPDSDGLKFNEYFENLGEDDEIIMVFKKRR